MKSVLYVLPLLCLVGCGETAKIARTSDEKTEGELKKLAEERAKRLAEEPLNKVENLGSELSLMTKDKADLERAREHMRLGEMGILSQPLNQRQVELFIKYGAKSMPPPPPSKDNILSDERIVEDLIFKEQKSLEGRLIQSNMKNVVEFTVKADNRTYRVSLSFSAERHQMDGVQLFSDGALKFLDVTKSPK